MRKVLITLCCLAAMLSVQARSWTADNGNGSFTNPLFYDEFSDPDIIRVGDDYYLAGTTMHCTPGLVILHSKDLVNWEWLSYCFDRFDFDDPAFHLEDGKEIYGQGIWAPCIRYHDGTFYVFSNINGKGLQVFISDNPAGPWRHIDMGGWIHDLSVLFDDDGKIYVVWGYDEVKIMEMKPDFTGYMPETERVIIPRGNAMGEGHHIYKINGKYYILSADYAPMGRMQCARADNIDGPYETTVISHMETMGAEIVTSCLDASGPLKPDDYQYHTGKAPAPQIGCATIHQGGIVELPNGDWWAISMQDFRAVGRTVCLSPITWVDGWPYFGLPGNLGRSPRTWVKPATGADVAPHAPYDRSDDFNGKALKPVWQWNHQPVDRKWVLKNGKLRLNAMPADNFMHAKNTLTQRIIGPVGVATVEIDASKLKDGDVAGLGLLNIPYSWLGMVNVNGTNVLRLRDQLRQVNLDRPLDTKRMWLRVTTLPDQDKAQYSYSFDGVEFENVGDTILLPYQLKTFQGPRYSLFAYSTTAKDGGYVEFDNFTVDEPLADRTANLPIGKTITLTNLATNQAVCALPHGMLHSTGDASSADCRFIVHDRGQGRVVLEAVNGTGFVTVVGQGLSCDVRLMPQESEGSLLQWQDMLGGHCMLLSLHTDRYLGTTRDGGEPYAANWAGPAPDRRDGTVLAWKVVED